jgi:hypothetical protein
MRSETKVQDVGSLWSSQMSRERSWGSDVVVRNGASVVHLLAV